MRRAAHSITHENEIVGGELPVAHVRFSIAISGRAAGRPYDIAIFETDIAFLIPPRVRILL
jgi:hypothetical protein